MPIVGRTAGRSPSPQQRVLDRQVAEQLAVQQASDRLEALRLEATNVPSLSPEQARRLDELLQQAQSEINRVRTQKEATAVLARTQDQLTQQLADPNADLRDEALAAMSETLAAEPLSRQLGDALQHEDPQATSDAVKALPERQRLALTLFHYEGMSQIEVGGAMGISDEAVESLLARARRTLKVSLKEEWRGLMPENEV